MSTVEKIEMMTLLRSLQPGLLMYLTDEDIRELWSLKRAGKNVMALVGKMIRK
jgi:hypothetical protein